MNKKCITLVAEKKQIMTLFMKKLILIVLKMQICNCKLILILMREKAVIKQKKLILRLQNDKNMMKFLIMGLFILLKTLD